MPEGTVDSAIEARVRRYILDNFGATKESVSLPQRPRPGSAAFDSGVEPIEEDQAIYGSGAAPAAPVAPAAPPAQAPAPTQPLELPPGGMSPDPADQLPDLFPEKAPSTMGEAGAKLADEWGPPPKPYSDYMGRQDTSWGSEETMRAAPAFKQFRQHVDAKIKHLQDYGSAKKVEGLVKALNGWLYDDEPTGPDGQLLPWARSTKDYREALHAFVIHSGFVVEPEKMTDEWLEDMTNFALSSQVRALQEMQNASWKRKGYDVGQPLHPSDWRQATKELKAFRDGREALLQSMYENNPKTLGLLHVMNRFGAGMASIPNAFGAGIELEKLLMNDEDYADFMRTLDIAGEESTATNVLGYGAQTGGMMLALGPLIKGVATGGLMLGMSEKAALQMATPTALFGLATPEAIETGSLKPYAGAAAFAALPYLSPHVQRFLSEKVPFMPAALGHKLGTAISFMAAAHSAQIAQGTPITWEQFRGDIFVSSLIGLMSKYRPPPGKAIKGKRVAAEPWMVDPTGSYSRYPFEGKIGQMPVDAKPGMGAPPRRPGLPEPGPDAVVGAVAPGAQGLGQSRELIAPPMKGRTRAGARVDRGPEPDIEGGVPGTETTWKYPRGDPRARPGGYAYRTGPPVPRYEPAPAPEGMVPRAGMPAAPTQPELPSQAGGPIVIPTSRLKLEAKLRKQSKPQLQNRLRGLKLKIGGNKDDLVTRILDKVEPIPAPTEVAPEPTRAAPAPTPAEPPGPRGGAVSELVQPEGRTQAPAPYEPSTGGIRMGPTAARGPDAERARMGELRRMKRPELENRLRQLGITNFKGRKDQLVRRVRDAEKKLEPPPHKLPKSGRWVAPTGPYSVWPSGTKRATTPNVPTGPTSPYPFEGRIERVPQQQRLGAGKPTPEGELGFDAPRVPKQPRVRGAKEGELPDGTIWAPGLPMGIASGGEAVMNMPEFKKLPSETRAEVIRHEFAHIAGAKKKVWSPAMEALWDAWEANPNHPIFDWFADKTGRIINHKGAKSGRPGLNAWSDEVLAELYAHAYGDGYMTYTHPLRNQKVTAPIPEGFRGPLDAIEAKLGIWGKRKARGAKSAAARAAAKLSAPPESEFTVEISGKRHPVNSLEEASDRYESARDDLGATMHDVPEALIYDKTGKQIAYISYNGRVWKGRPSYTERDADAEILLDRRAMRERPGQAPDVPALKSAAARAAAKPTADRAYVRGKEKVVLVPVSEIHEDPGTFQFKAGMDPKTGVGGKLKDVKEHLTLEGGLSLIWERADGKKFIAEGHQRLGVAKRTGEEAINAVVVREVDGVTARQARGMGALANIANGNGTAIDVARVMTDFGWGKAELEAKSIDTKSKLVRDAMGLQGLSPEALSQVINEVISEAYGGIIGRVLKGQPGKQMEAIKAATKGEGAKNADTVEFLARDIRDAREVTETTTGLFGEEVTVRSTVLERGEVQAKIKKILTDNKGLARKLRGNVKRASAMGTDVDVKGAKAAEAAAGDVLGTIELRSNAGGAVERIISDAGRKVAEGTPVEKAAQEALRRLESVDWKTDTEGGAPGVRPAAGAPRPREAGEGLIPPEVGDAASGVRRPKGESGFMFIPGGRGVSDMMAEVGDFLGKGWWYVGLSNIERMQASKDPMRRMFGKGLEWVNDNAKALTGDQWGMATAREAAVKAARFRVGLKRKFGNALESTGMSHASNVGDVVKSFRAYGAELISGRASTANEFLNNLVYRIRRGLDIGNQQDVELGLKRLTTAGKMELIERIEGGEIDVRYPGRDRVFVLRDPALRRHLGNATYDRMKASGRRVKLDKIQADLKKMAERFERDGSLEMGRIAAEYQRVFEHVPDWLQVNGKRYQINDFNPDSYISNVMGLRAASVRSRNYVFGQGKKGGLPPTLKAIRTSEGMSGKTFKQYMRMSGGMQPVRSWSQAAMEGAPPMVRKFVGGILQVNDALRAAGLSASTISQVAEFPAGRAMTFAGVRRGIPGLGDALKQHGIRAPGIRKLTQAYNKHTAERVGAVMNDVFSPAIEAGRTGGSMMDTAIDTLHAVNLRSGTEQFQARQAVETIGRADLTWQKRAKSGKDYNIEKQSYGQRVLDWSDVLMLQEMGVEGQLARRIVEGKEFGAHTERILRQAATRLTGGGMTPLEEGRFWQTSGMRTLFWYNRYSAMRIMGITKNLEVGLRGMRDAVREPNLTRRQRAARMTAATLRFGYEHATATAQGALQYYFWSMFSPGGTERTKAEFEDDKVAFAFKSWASTVAAGSVGPFFRTIFEREGGPFNINHWLDMVGPVRPAREITNYLQDQSVYRTMESGREKLGGVVKRTLPAARVIDKVTTALTGTKLEKEYALRQEAGRKLITWRFDNDMRPSSAKAGDFLVESQEKLSRLMAETSGDIESGDYNGAIHKVVEALGLPGASITKIRASIRQRLALKDFLPTKNDTDEVATAKLEKLQAYVKARGEKDLMALVRRDVEIEDWLQDLADAFGKRRVRKFRPSRRRR